MANQIEKMESTRSLRDDPVSGAATDASSQGSIHEKDRNAECMDQEFLTHCSAGNSSAETGNFKHALQSFARALEIRPDAAFLHSNIAYVHLKLGERTAAVASYKAALAIDPCSYQAQYSISNTLYELGRIAEAIVGYRRTLVLNPSSEGAYLNLGNALKDQGKLHEAKACYLHATELAPHCGAAWRNLSALYCDTGNFKMAISAGLKAIAIEPASADAHFNLALALQREGQLDSAIKEYRHAVSIAPNHAGAHLNLGIALGQHRLLDEAVASIGSAITINPNFAEAHSSLGNLLIEVGRIEPAILSFERALQISPNFAEAHSNLLFCLCHKAGMSSEMLLKKHLLYGARHDSDQIESFWSSERFASLNRSLRIGFVSADLRNHAVVNFLLPILAQLSRKPTLSLWAYSNSLVDDHVTAEIQTHFDRWTTITRLPDDDLAKKIRDDSIDILIDLSGHTGRNRLPVFCKRAAPIQVSWLGYPCTTGIHAMDYYMADRSFISDKAIAEQFTERLVYLPATVAFAPSGDSPPVNSLPALDNGYLTFGSFNRLSKISTTTVALWSQVLRMIPTSRLLMAAVPSESIELVSKWFMAEGIEGERLDFHPRCSMAKYLQLYHRVDICLDTFPYSGGTTTCHGLWMGVPTLTLTGACPQSRVGGAILTLCGLTQFVANSGDHFVELGVAASEKLGTLACVRSDMRAQLKKSTIMRPDLIANAMELAFVEMWRRRSRGHPGDALDVSYVS